MVSAHVDKRTGEYIFILQCGVRVIVGENIVWFYGTTFERRYYLIYLSEITDSKAICTLKRGERAKSERWYSVEQITKSEYGTYEEFGLFPELEHANEPSRQ